MMHKTGSGGPESPPHTLFTGRCTEPAEGPTTDASLVLSWETGSQLGPSGPGGDACVSMGTWGPMLRRGGTV